MNVVIEQDQTGLSKKLRKSVQQRAGKILQRFAHRLRSTRLAFRGTAGSKGGTNKECVVQAKLVNGGEIIVAKRGRNIPQALFRALRSLRNMIIRKAARERQLRYGFLNRNYALGKE